MRLSAPVHQLKRRARNLARSENIALHEALDRIARDEGFAAWSLLSAQFARTLRPKSILPGLADGDLLLLGGRPGQGKTLLGLQLLLDAIRQGRRAMFFTLEYSDREARERVRSLDGEEGSAGDKLEIVSSDEICAEFIVQRLAGAPRGTVAVIDYLQILDQRRSKPILSEQMLALRDFGRRSGIVLGFISQIDRSFDPERKPIPDIGDIRLPNPIDLGLFSKACFLHEGALRFQHLN